MSGFAIINEGMVVLSDGIARGGYSGEVKRLNSRKVYKISSSCALTWTAFTDKILEKKIISNLDGCGPEEAINIISEEIEEAVSSNKELKELLESNPENNFSHINCYGYNNSGILDWWHLKYTLSKDKKYTRRPEYVGDIKCAPPKPGNLFSNLKAGAHIVGYKGNDNPWRDYLKKEITNNTIISGNINPITSLEALKKVSFNAFKSLVEDLSHAFGGFQVVRFL